MESEQLITVIVPVYKAEAYLEACIRSVLAQTLTRWELILVDDGSPDGCPWICDRYAAADARIRVLHQENRGISLARNAGLDAAMGAWITFLDADDLLPEDALERLMTAALETRADLIMGNFVRKADGDTAGQGARLQRHLGFRQGTRSQRPVEIRKGSGFKRYLGLSREVKPLKEAILSSEEALAGWHLDYKSVEASVWGKLYDRRLFDPAGGRQLRFAPGRFHEDVLLIHLLAAEAGKIAVIPETVYIYRIHGQSLTHSRITEKKVRDHSYAQLQRLKYFAKSPYRDSYKRLLVLNMKGWMLYYCRSRRELPDSGHLQRQLRRLFLKHYEEAMQAAGPADRLLFVLFRCLPGFVTYVLSPFYRQ